jgi:ankyrin repeat protein
LEERVRRFSRKDSADSISGSKVLQEVAASRQVLIKCGSAEMDGYAFCMGLQALGLSLNAHPDLQSLIPTATYLMRGALFRPRRVTSPPSPGRFSLQIRPLRGLVDMYHTREATDPRDKVYALLGMSSDDGAKTAFSADYAAPWGEVFRRSVHRFLSEQVSVDTWDDKEIAVIRGKGRILGEVYSVMRDDATWEDVQTVDIAWRDATSHLGAREKGTSRWTLQSGAKPVKVGDAICLVQGASRPTIVRQRHDHWAIIRVAVQPPDGQVAVRQESPSEPSRTPISPYDILLVWDWAPKPQLGGYGKLLIRHPVPNRSEWEDCLDEAVRLQNVCLVSQDLTSYDTSIESLQRTMDILEQVWGSVGASESGCPSRAGLVTRASVVVDRFREHDGGWTAICVAAARGLEAVVKLLLDTDIRWGDKDGGLLTPLWLAAQNGHEAVCKLLLGTGEVGLGGSSWIQDWAIGRAVVEGHGTVAKLLLDTGRVFPNATVGQDTLLGLAARDGNGAMTKLLLQKGADLELRNSEGLPPLYLAAEEGHKQVVELLLERGANPHHYAGHSDLTALSIAAQKGHDAVVRLLLEKGADPRYVDREDDTPLGLAAEGGHESVVRQLLEKGVDLEHMGLRTTAPLMRAVMGGHEAVVKLLLERGADTNGYNEDGDTLLLSAVREGSEAVARLLLEKGADPDYMSPLELAAELGHEAVVRLLLEKGANVDSVSWMGRHLRESAAYGGIEQF